MTPCHNIFAVTESITQKQSLEYLSCLHTTCLFSKNLFYRNFAVYFFVKCLYKNPYKTKKETLLNVKVQNIFMELSSKNSRFESVLSLFFLAYY